MTLPPQRPNSVRVVMYELSWLREVYENACSTRQWTVVARVYLLQLVGCTIFANKSVTSVSVTYLGFFIYLRVTEVMHGHL